MRNRRSLVVLAVAGSVVLASCSSSPPEVPKLEVKTGPGAPVTISPAQLARLADGGAVVGVGNSPNGTVAAARGGGLVFTPKAGFTGAAQLTATVSPAVARYSSNIPAMLEVGGVSVDASGYGSAWTPVPGAPGEFYGLTDRGPNVDGPGDNEKVAVTPDFTPQIGRFTLADGEAKLQSVITLKGRDSRPMVGLTDTENPTGEKLVDLDGKELPASDHGIDSEGLVALPDGTFWVSDEYGPNIVHVDANGQEIDRLSPGRGLPEVLRTRTPNQGMEGLTITPDGSRLVGMMQSALSAPGLDGNAKEVPVTRVVVIDLKTKAVRQYAYLLDDPQRTKKAVSEITALSNTEFLVNERDGKLPPKANKSIFRINLSGATELGERNPETIAGVGTTADAQTALKSAGITPVGKSVALDLSGLLDKLNPQGQFYGHDKVEGLATTDGGKTLYIANDSDFGLSGITGPKPPFGLKPKILANGLQDSLEVLKVDTSKLNEPVAQRTITVTVG